MTHFNRWMPGILIFASLALSLPASAQTGNRSINIDPTGEAFSIGGWSRRAAETGTIFYTCQQEDCGKGSIVSMRKQTQPPPPNKAAMRAGEQRVVDQIRERAQGKIARIDIGEPDMENDNVYRLGEIDRTIVTAQAGDMGFQLYWKTGFVASANGIYTLASSADSRRAADENYKIYKTGVMLMLAMKKQ